MKFFSVCTRKAINLYRREILRDKPLLEAKRWFRDNGDLTLRLEYDLRPDSIVVDLGGYVGDFAQQIYDRYGCTIHLFEPVPSLHARCVERFVGIKKIFCHNYGLGSNSGFFPVTDNEDKSSFVSHSKTDKYVNAELRSISEVFDSLALDHIDLLKINIEGGEYDVLPAIINAGWMSKIKNIQIQFHTCGDNYESARESIRTELAKTHVETWCYRFVWENWRLGVK